MNEELDVLDDQLFEELLSRPSPYEDDALIHRELADTPLTADEYLLPLYHAEQIPDNLPCPGYDRSDPLAPLNLTRHHPDTANDIFIACISVKVTGPWGSNIIWTLVDRTDEPSLQNLCWNILFREGKRYIRHRRKRQDILLHRLVMEHKLRDNPAYLASRALHFGCDASLPAEVLIRQLLGIGHVHHINHDTEDNRRLNLDLILPTLNQSMQQRVTASKSGYRGVEIQGNCFRARLHRVHKGNRERKDVGRFPSALEAAANRILFQLLHGEWMQKGYRPAPDERPLWNAVAFWLESGFLSGPLHPLGKLTEETQQRYAQARKHLKMA